MEETVAFTADYITEQENSPNFKLSKIDKYCWDYFREDVHFFCENAFRLFYFMFGILQFFAIWDWLEEVYHTSNLAIAIGSFVLAFLPCIGTGFGIFATQNIWGWDLPNCLVIFLAPYVIVNGPLIFIAMCEVYKDVKRWRAEGKV